MASNELQLEWLKGLGLTCGGSLTAVPEQQPGTSASLPSEFEQLDRSNTSSNTLKRNPKVMDLSKNDLLKLITYFEGEIQARDVVIAALKSEQLKQVVSVGRYRPAVLADPYTALLRDGIADGPNSKPSYTEREMVAAAKAQLQALEHLTLQQRQAHSHMINILKEAEAKHKKVIQELEEEKCKHEHDTAQGDDITYGLEMERTRLKQELEMEHTAKKKLEKEIKKQLEMSDEERARQKQIVLLLLAERKKIIVKYIEERRRSEDLVQILTEEKSRIDTMAEGLEEESKKSLQMEAELEKQLHIFEADKKSLNIQLVAKENRCQELELELQKLKAELDILKSRSSSSSCDSASPLLSNVAKVVQPTATVTSVPVCGPTTGIALSVTPGQALRQSTVASPLPLPSKVAPPVPGSLPARNIPSKVGYHPNVNVPSTIGPQTPPKKGMIAARGVPPPIPPNKPIIPNKQPAPRRTDNVDLIDKKKTIIIKDPTEGIGTVTTTATTTTLTISTTTTTATTTSTTTTTTTTTSSSSSSGCSSSISGGSASNKSGQGIEILGQELADFQQMFVTMATSNNT